MPADAVAEAADARPPFLSVRHGQTECNVRGILAGSTDVALTGDAPALIVAHGGILHALARLLQVTDGDGGVIDNAVPVRFVPSPGGAWTVRPL